MAQRTSARQRLVEAAFQLFSSQGVAATTTRQVAELADVNEVTLFRQFGSKYGLLAAVMTEAEVLSSLPDGFDREAMAQLPLAQALRSFFAKYLTTLDQLSELMRSVVGEAGQFSVENRQAVGQSLQNAHQFTLEYFDRLWPDATATSAMANAELAGLITALMVGYTMIDGTTTDHALWLSRETFIEGLVGLGLGVWVSNHGEIKLEPVQELIPETVADLPAPVVHQIMQAARKVGGQPYALVYVLFGAGLTPLEVLQLQRVNAVHDQRQHILQVGANRRQVPLNQWIMGERYGTYTKNPLTRWLKSRSDRLGCMFLGPAEQPMTMAHLQQLWAEVTADLVTPAGHPPGLEQTRITWCIDMLLKGLDGEGLSLLTGLSTAQLAPVLKRGQERAALEQALRLDRQPGQD